ERLADVAERQDLAGNLRHTGVERRGLAALRHAKEPHSLRGEAASDLVRAVDRAVGDDEDVHQLAGIVQGKDGLQLALEKFLPVVNGDDKRDGAQLVVLVDRIVGAPRHPVQQQRVAEEDITNGCAGDDEHHDGENLHASYELPRPVASSVEGSRQVPASQTFRRLRRVSFRWDGSSNFLGPALSTVLTLNSLPVPPKENS